MEETPLLVQPDPADPRLTRRVAGIDQTGARIEASVTVERPLTLYLNGQEIVTMMTILDRPEDLALGYLLNQGMLRRDDAVTGVEYDDDLQVVVVRTERRTDYEAKLKKKTLTSGCAQGTAFGDLLEDFAGRRMPAGAVIRTSASAGSRAASKSSRRSPKAVPWAQPLVSVFFRSFRSKSVFPSVRTTTTPRSSSYSTADTASPRFSMFWLSR